MRHSVQEIQYLTTRTSYSSLVHGLYAHCMDLNPNPGSRQQIPVLPKIYFYGRLGHCVCIIWFSCNSQQHLHWKERQVIQDFLLFSLCHGLKLHVSQVSIKKTHLPSPQRMGARSCHEVISHQGFLLLAPLPWLILYLCCDLTYVLLIMTKFLFLARAIRFQLWMNSSSCTSQGQCAIFIRFTSLLHKVAIN